MVTSVVVVVVGSVVDGVVDGVVVLDDVGVDVRVVGAGTLPPLPRARMVRP
jgi:transketolase C-terminal domain/subunit